MNRPLGVSLISYFYIFGAIVLLFTAVFYNADTNSIGIAERFGLPNVPEQFMRILVALISLGMVYGYMRLKAWGFWFMVTYSMLFGIISSILMLNKLQQPFIGNMMLAIITLAYTVYAKRHFFKQISNV